MLCRDPKSRISAEEALSHSYFKTTLKIKIEAVNIR